MKVLFTLLGSIRQVLPLWKDLGCTQNISKFSEKLRFCPGVREKGVPKKPNIVWTLNKYRPLALSPSSSWRRRPRDDECGVSKRDVTVVLVMGFVKVLLPRLEEEEDDDEDPKRLNAAKEVPNIVPYPC